MSGHFGQFDEQAADWVMRRERGLTAEEERAFATWLAADPAHREALAEHEGVWTMLDGPKRTGAARPMMGELARRSTKRRRRRQAIASCLAVALVFGTLWVVHRPGSRVGTLPQPSETIQLLADGSRAQLGPGTTMDVRFEAAVRRVALHSGRVQFEVAKNPARPFIVTASDVNVQAVGTVFSVGIAGNQVQVAITEGRIRVSLAHPSDEQDRAAIYLDAGETLTLAESETKDLAGAAGAVGRLSDPAAAGEPAWTSVRLEFAETPLAEAAALMNRNSPTRIVIEDPESAALRVNGSFRSDDSETFIRLLEANFELTAQRTDRTIVLRRTRP